MSHFSLIVALPSDTYDVEKELADRLAPYDENQEATPYKVYEETSPENFWWVSSFRRSAEEVANNDRSSIKTYNPDGFFSFSSSESKETEEEQWEKIKKEAEVYNSLPQPLTWEGVVKAYNRYYCEGFPYDDGEPLNYDPETGGAFEWSTYNPRSQWDWYSVGGRWSGYFPIGTYTPDLISGRRAYGLGEHEIGTCDGGPKWALDLEELRGRKEHEAGLDYDAYHAAFGHLPVPKAWSHYLSLVDDGLLGIDSARDYYGSQVRVSAVREHPEWRSRWSVDHEKYARPREVVVQEARDHAVPGYALLTLDKVWVAPGKMGLFGMSSENDSEMDAYKAAANEYIDNLDPNTILVVVDLHI